VPGVAADPFVGAFLHGAQQFGLQFQGQFADFVEKERAAVGAGERAVALAGRAGERAALVAEKFAARQFGLHRRAVQDDQTAFISLFVERVDEPRDLLFARAALAGDEQRSVGKPRDFDGLPQHAPPRRAPAHEVVLHQRRVQQRFNRLPTGQARGQPCARVRRGGQHVGGPGLQQTPRFGARRRRRRQRHGQHAVQPAVRVFPQKITQPVAVPLVKHHADFAG
jgi:hypothetical protein